MGQRVAVTWGGRVRCCEFGPDGRTLPERCRGLVGLAACAEHMSQVPVAVSFVLLDDWRPVGEIGHQLFKEDNGRASGFFGRGKLATLVTGPIQPVVVGGHVETVVIIPRS